jgi:hypothetical protein
LVKQADRSDQGLDQLTAGQFPNHRNKAVDGRSACKFLQRDSGPRRFDQRSSDRRWNVDRDEAIGGEQVVLSALLDDSDVAVSFSIAGDDAIDLVLLQ